MHLLFRFGMFCLLLLGVLLTGCQPKEELPITGLVSGNVTFNGKPVAAGVISFENKQDGVGATAKIADGKFTFDGGVSAGHYQVTVSPPQAEPPPLNAPPQAPQQYNDIPAKYRSSSTSDLTVDIVEGENKVDFALKP